MTAVGVFVLLPVTTGSRQLWGCYGDGWSDSQKHVAFSICIHHICLPCSLCPFPITKLFLLFYIVELSIEELVKGIYWLCAVTLHVTWTGQVCLCVYTSICVCVCVCMHSFCNLLRTISCINSDLVGTISPFVAQKTGPNVAKLSDTLDECVRVLVVCVSHLCLSCRHRLQPAASWTAKQLES